MMKNTFKRGFTLIELLVVIAIIGILAAVVLASLNSARDKGSDAATKSNLNNIRAQAELVYDDLSRSYDNGTNGVCNDPNVSRAVQEAGGSCGDLSTAWAAEAPLFSSNAGAGTGDYYCVDSTGNATTTEGTSITVTSGSEELVCG